MKIFASTEAISETNVQPEVKDISQNKKKKGKKKGAVKLRSQ